MMGERLRLRYIEDTNTIVQIWLIFPYSICLVLNSDGELVELIIDEHDENT